MTGRAIPTVTCDLGLRLVVAEGTSLPVSAELRYDARDPYAVHATFRAGESETVCWVFARELLTSGLRAPTGDGDVRVWPCPGTGEGDCLRVSLSSPEGSAVLEAPAAQLRRFLGHTYCAVPVGAEHRHLDLDGVVERLLSY